MSLCGIALHVIAHALDRGERRTPSLAGLDPALCELAATFVTLERNDRLLGCVGTLRAHQPLAIDVAEHALAAAFDDTRVPAVTRADFPEMSVKVSVLSPSTPVVACSFEDLRTRVRPGIDGLTVETGETSRATLLPSVWAKLRDSDEFLAALWSKAGLHPRAWPADVRIFRYTTVEECDSGPRPCSPRTAGRSRWRL
jgi:AmmeMemoRadiSam system protein A